MYTPQAAIHGHLPLFLERLLYGNLSISSVFFFACTEVRILVTSVQHLHKSRKLMRRQSIHNQIGADYCPDVNNDVSLIGGSSCLSRKMLVPNAPVTGLALALCGAGLMRCQRKPLRPALRPNGSPTPGTRNSHPLDRGDCMHLHKDMRVAGLAMHSMLSNLCDP